MEPLRPDTANDRPPESPSAPNEVAVWYEGTPTASGNVRRHTESNTDPHVWSEEHATCIWWVRVLWITTTVAALVLIPLGAWALYEHNDEFHQSAFFTAGCFTVLTVCATHRSLGTSLTPCTAGAHELVAHLPAPGSLRQAQRAAVSHSTLPVRMPMESGAM